MTSGDFRVTPQLLQQTSTDLRAQAAELLSQLESFNKDVQARSATGEGAAKESYSEKHAQWTDGMHQMQQALQAFAVLVDELASNYITTDQAGSQTFSALSTGR